MPRLLRRGEVDHIATAGTLKKNMLTAPVLAFSWLSRAQLPSQASVKQRRTLFKMLLRNLPGSLPLTSALPSAVGSIVGGVVETVVGAPTVELDYGKFKGNSDHLGVDSFLGLPFAKAGRLEIPRLVNANLDKLEGIQDATKHGDACPQSQFTGLSSNTKACLSSRQRRSITILIIASVEWTSSNAGADCLRANRQPRGRLPEH